MQKQIIQKETFVFPDKEKLLVHITQSGKINEIMNISLLYMTRYVKD